MSPLIKGYPMNFRLISENGKKGRSLSRATVRGLSAFYNYPIFKSSVAFDFLRHNGKVNTITVFSTF